MNLSMIVAGRVQINPLPPYTGETYRAATAVIDGKLYAGTAAAAALDLNAGGETLVEDVDWSPVSDFSLMRFDEGTSEVGDDVFQTLTMLRRGDAVVATVELYDRIPKGGTRKLPFFRCVSLKIVEVPGQKKK